MSDLADQRTLFQRLIARGEEVTEALDHVRAIGDLGTAELERLVAALGSRELPPVAITALAALSSAVERVLDDGDPHRAIDWIGMQPRLVTTLLLGAMNPAALPVDAAQASTTRAQGATAVAAQLPTGISFTDAPRDGRAIVYSGIQADPMLRPIAVAIAGPAVRIGFAARETGSTGASGIAAKANCTSRSVSTFVERPRTICTPGPRRSLWRLLPTARALLLCDRYGPPS